VWQRNITSITSADRGYTLYLSRKPDSDWPIAIFKPSAGPTKEKIIQFLDYNLRVRRSLATSWFKAANDDITMVQRLDKPIVDKKGLEFTTLLSLITFISDTLYPMLPIAPLVIEPVVVSPRDKGKGKEIISSTVSFPSTPVLVSLNIAPQSIGGVFS
jgi:hypothetical protein